MGKIAESVEVLTKPFNKLIETIGCGIGKVYEPTYIKRMADANAYAIETIEKAVENSQLHVSYENDGVSIENKE